VGFDSVAKNISAIVPDMLNQTTARNNGVGVFEQMLEQHKFFFGEVDFFVASFHQVGAGVANGTDYRDWLLYVTGTAYLCV
jgi:hypothetical protein